MKNSIQITMKKTIAILMMVLTFGMIVNAQTNYSPTILEVEIPYPNGTDTITRVVKQTMGAWYDDAMKVRLTRFEYMSNDTVPHKVDKFVFTQNMADTITHTRDNGNDITMTGREFTELIFDNGGAINWALWAELGRSIYFEYWDTEQYYIIKD